MIPMVRGVTKKKHNLCTTIKTPILGAYIISNADTFTN